MKKILTNEEIMRKKALKKEYDKKNREKNKERDKEYRENNKDKVKEYKKNKRERINELQRLRRKNNTEQTKKYNEKHKEYCKEYYKKNKDKIIKQVNTYKHNKTKNDSLYKLKRLTQNLIKNSFRIKNEKKSKRTVEILGCSINEFKEYLQNKFSDWMNWDNYGKWNGTPNFGWDVDHIIPISSAKTIEDIIKLNHYTNLQPLCSHTNRYIKRNKIKEG